MRLSRLSYAIVASAITVSVVAYFYFVPKYSTVDVNTVIATPKPSAPPIDKRELLRRAAAGDSDAQCRLSGRFQTGTDGLPFNPPLAYYWATSSAAKHDPCGINNLANLYEDGIWVSRDQQTAIQLYELAASLGDLNAMANLGRSYYFGDGVDKNIVTALSWYKKAADRGDFISLRTLGEIYGWGEGVPLNIDRSSAYLLRANPIHDGQAAYDLGWLYYRYYPRKERCERTVHWLMTSARLDDADGESMLGWMYEFGVCGVRKNAYEAATWYRKAMDRDPAAEQKYAMLIWEGSIGRPDKQRAVRYLREAAVRGSEDAMYVLGVAYEHGNGVKPNLNAAWQYYTAAADRGQVNALSVVASAYLVGFRVKRDWVRGYGMLLAGESLGDYVSPRDKQRLSKNKSAHELAAAQRFAFAYAAKIKNKTGAYPWLAPPVSSKQRVD